MEIFEVKELFHAVQMERIFADGKTFVDCTPLHPPAVIEAKYAAAKDQPGFDLRAFVLENFEPPKPPGSTTEQQPIHATTDAIRHIEQLWPLLTRQADDQTGTSLLPLPHPYIVPGGRFGEVYYWDSYFTLLGLRASGHVTMVAHMVNNFSTLIDVLGYVPNGNRTYYIGRSQPPFYPLMVQLLADLNGPEVLVQYLPQLEKEYQYWMQGADTLTPDHTRALKTVRMPDGSVLNRYCDANSTPRPESYREDVELAEHSSQPSEALYQHLRAGAESGWDYSCRWFKDEDAFQTIHTTEVVPTDLNCLLYFSEKTLAQACLLDGNSAKSDAYAALAEQRKAAIQQYLWNAERGFFFDYDHAVQAPKTTLTLAGVFPLFFGIATPQQAQSVADVVEQQFLKAGGVVSTLKTTGQQWDAPNGWAPLQWITITGLQQYGFTALAREIADRWTKLNLDVFARTGKMMEKYNVVDTHLEAGGGEYEGQDGFGWTNGVLLALLTSNVG